MARKIVARIAARELKRGDEFVNGEVGEIRKALSLSPRDWCGTPAVLVVTERDGSGSIIPLDRELLIVRKES